LNLVRLKFLVARSGVLNATVFFVPDDATKASLVFAGANGGNIYTRSELVALVRRRVTPTELQRIYAVRQIFKGSVADR